MLVTSSDRQSVQSFLTQLRRNLDVQFERSQEGRGKEGLPASDDRLETGCRGHAQPQYAANLPMSRTREVSADPEVARRRVSAQVGEGRAHQAAQANRANRTNRAQGNNNVNMQDIENRRFRGFREVDVNRLREALPPQARHLAQSFIDAGRRHNLDPLALAAISRHESANFASSAFRNKNNAMGVSNARGPIHMRSHEQSIDYMASRLNSPTGPYRNANTLKELWHIYSPPSSQNGGRPVSNDPRDLNRHWGAGVERFIREYERAVGR